MRRALSPSLRSTALAALGTLVGVAWGLPAPAPLAAQDEGIAVGTVVAPFVMEDLAGDSVDLAYAIGRRPVLMEFWATYCPICRVLDPKLRAAREEFGDRVEFLVVAVAVGQRKEQVQPHIARHPVAGRVLWDARGAAARAFEAPGTGYVVLLDETGTVRWTGTGADMDFASALRDLFR